MRHEKIYRRDDGTHVRISARVWVDYRGASYRVSVSTKAKRKRTWVNVHDSDNYSWRRLDKDGRDNFTRETHSRYVTEAEILETLKELWQKMEPKTLNYIPE